MLFQSLAIVALTHTVLAARPFLNEPDTGIELALPDLQPGTLPNLSAAVGIPDFDFLARNFLNASSYSYYRNGAGGEWSYRNNLEAYQRVRFRPRVLQDITNIEASLPTKILGHNVSAPFFISPCARAGYGHPEGEINLLKAAASEKLLYMISDYSSRTKAEIQAAKDAGQILFQQLYLKSDFDLALAQVKTAESAGFHAAVLTVDAAASSNRHRANRFGVASSNNNSTYLTWETFKKLKAATKIPLIPKGIMTVEDAKMAISYGAPAIFISNHGGRQLDGVPSPLEIALEIYEKAPEVFKKVEVYADGGVRYGGDALKLLALGVKAVGIGRPMMYANVYGVEGVQKAIQIFRRELFIDSGNLGVGDIKKIDTRYVS
jgi:isopentenyl diphosphate isomerase/L-lactate dehydrogenase-like FMN-dependent dehydrogenase